MKSATAIIRWIPRSEGGRTRPPTGTRYLAPAAFNHGEDWRQPMWTLVVELATPATTEEESTAQIRFLMENSPTEFLQPGQHFALYEGKRRVAEGDVISEEHRPTGWRGALHRV